MGLFGSAKPPKAGGPKPDVARMFVGRATVEEEMVNRALYEQQQQQLSALEEERRAVNEVAERERQMLSHIAAMQTQLTEQTEEAERARKAEEDLHKALRLAAERLSGATSHEGGLRAELEDANTQLADSRRQVEHLQARLYGEKGIKLQSMTGGGGPTGAHAPLRAEHDDDVITSLVTGAVPAARDAASMVEERHASTRHAREQVKRLLYFVKKQLADDLQTWRGHGDAPPPELSASIGKQRALASKLEAALHELMGASAPPPGNGGGFGGNAAGGRPSLDHAGSSVIQERSGLGVGGAVSEGIGFAIRVHGDMLPRTVAVNDATIRPILLASGPAVRWVMRQHDAPPVTPNTKAAKAKAIAQAAAGGEEEADTMNWVAGETLMLVIEAIDDADVVDVDFDAVVLLECEAHVQGRGLVKVSKGVGFVPLLTTQSGEVTVNVQDGGFSTMEPPLPLRIDFKVSAPPPLPSRSVASYNLSTLSTSHFYSSVTLVRARVDPPR